MAALHNFDILGRFDGGFDLFRKRQLSAQTANCCFSGLLRVQGAMRFGKVLLYFVGGGFAPALPSPLVN
jgi:hypothetical protein